MKRSPLNPGTSRLKRSGFLRHAALKSAGKPLKSVQKYDPTEEPCKKVVKKRSGGRCEICGVRPGQSVHHRRRQAQGGPWLPSNCVHLCGDGRGPDGCHGMVSNPRAEHYVNGWLVHSWDDWREIPFLQHTLGAVFLRDDDNYYFELEEAS